MADADRFGLLKRLHGLIPAAGETDSPRIPQTGKVRFASSEAAIRCIGGRDERGD